MKQRRLNERELVAFAAAHCGMQPGDFERYTADEVVMVDDEVHNAPWPYSTKLTFLLRCWEPAGKPN
jgi:hypothetical protein